MIGGVHVVPKLERVLYGPSAAHGFFDTLTAQGSPARLFALTSRSAAKTGFFRSFGRSIGPRCVGEFPGISAHSPLDEIVAAAVLAREAGADAIVAVGGGSVIDTAKGVQACLWEGLSSVEQLMDWHRDPAAALTPGPAKPRIVAVPTTLSAAEFTPIAGITDPVAGIKYILDDPHLIPQTIVLDPEATLETPERLFLASGIRAVDHCVETLCSASPTPFGTATAKEGLQLLTKGLRAVKADPADVAARAACQVGMWLAISGPSSGVPVGASHAIGRVLGGAFGVPHGETSCVLLPAALRWNAAAEDRRQAEIPTLMGETGGQTAAECVAALIGELGLPTRLRDVGVDRTAFEEIAGKSLVMCGQRLTAGNIRPVRSAEDVLEILDLAE